MFGQGEQVAPVGGDGPSRHHFDLSVFSVVVLLGQGFGAGVSTRAIVISVLLLSMKIFAPLGRQPERERKRLFDRGIFG
jgi:hypothetical protein